MLLDLCVLTDPFISKVSPIWSSWMTVWIWSFQYFYRTLKNGNSFSCCGLLALQCYTLKVWNTTSQRAFCLVSFGFSWKWNPIKERIEEKDPMAWLQCGYCLSLTRDLLLHGSLTLTTVYTAVTTWLHSYNPSTWKAEVGRLLQVWNQFDLHREFYTEANEGCETLFQ